MIFCKLNEIFLRLYAAKIRVHAMLLFFLMGEWTKVAVYLLIIKSFTGLLFDRDYILGTSSSSFNLLQ